MSTVYHVFFAIQFATQTCTIYMTFGCLTILTADLLKLY